MQQGSPTETMMEMPQKFEEVWVNNDQELTYAHNAILYMLTYTFFLQSSVELTSEQMYTELQP